MFMNSNSSTETNSDEDKYRGSIVEWIRLGEQKEMKKSSLRRKSFDESTGINNAFEFDTSSNHGLSEDLRLEKTG